MTDILTKHPVPWSLTQSPLKLEPTIRDANDVTVEEIPFAFLVKCVNAFATLHDAPKTQESPHDR